MSGPQVSNPWRRLARNRVDSDRAARLAQIDAVYDAARIPDPEDCPRRGCNGRVWWRVDVGASVCPDCGLRIEVDGKVVRDRPVREAEWSKP